MSHKQKLVAYPVLKISGCSPYSLANTNGTIPCGRAAWKHRLREI